MFNGAHVVICSSDADADRAVFRDILGLGNVDVGGGWLIFALPDSQVAFHPHESSTEHVFYFLAEDVEDVRAKLSAHGLECAPARDEGWGILSSFTLPGGGTVGFYQPNHERPKSA